MIKKLKKNNNEKNEKKKWKKKIKLDLKQKEELKK